MRSTICALLCIASSMPRGMEQRRADIASAGAVGVRDRWRRQQRRPQLVCVVDSRQRRPAFTTTPIGESASSRRESGCVRPAFSRLVSASPTMITTSACSPRARRLGIACGVFPIDGPGITTRWLPVCFSHAGASFSSAALKPPEIITVTSADNALPPVAASSSVASRVPVVLRIIFSLINVPSAAQRRYGDRGSKWPADRRWRQSSSSSRETLYHRYTQSAPWKSPA